MPRLEAIKIPAGVSEKMAGQMAAELAHRYNRTILLEANGKNKRILVIDPEQFHHEGPKPSLLSDIRNSIDHFRDLRSAQKRAHLWAKSLEEKLQEES